MADAETYVRLFYKGITLLVPMSFVVNVHPGGAEYILQYSNQDITSAFEDMNHSTDALALLKTFEEKDSDQKKKIYDADDYERVAREALSFDEENKRVAEARQWRQRSVFTTVATTLAAMGAVAYALRRHHQNY